jgi:hypothetical protein
MFHDKLHLKFHLQAHIDASVAHQDSPTASVRSSASDMCPPAPPEPSSLGKHRRQANPDILNTP